MHVTLVLTHECNLACTYCYTGEKFRSDMPIELGRRGVEMAFDNTPAGEPVDLGFFGGEPTLCWPTMEALASEARARAEREHRQLRLAVTTNGTLIDAHRATRLRELDFSVTLSLDGVREAHEATRPQKGGQSSFDDVLRGARHLTEAGHPLEVIAVVAPDNVRHLGESVKFLVELGARQVLLNPCFEEPWSDADLTVWESGMRDAAEVYASQMRAGNVVAMPTFDNKLLAAAKGGLAACDSCGAGEREIAVSPAGYLYPCARMVGEDRDRTLTVGHIDTGINQSSIRAIKKGPLDPVCETCAERWRCGAGCACANLAETGTTHLPGGTQCWYEQASARVADAIGRELLAERNETFIRWIYGRVASAARAHGIAPEDLFPLREPPMERVQRVRRLPVMKTTNP